MDKFFELISTASLGVSALVIAVVLLGAFYLLYAIPRFKEHEELVTEKKAWETKLNTMQDALNRANDVVKKHVEESKTNIQLEELLRTCQSIQNILAESVRKTETGMKDLSTELDSVYEKIMDIRRYSENDQSAPKFHSLDLEMRLMSQQLATITNRLSSISGILIGNSPGSALFEDMLHERKLK